MDAPLAHRRVTTRLVARAMVLVAALFALLTVSGGCGYVIHLRGVQVEEQPKVSPSARMWVGRSPSVEAADEEDEAIRQKLEILLRSKGYAVVKKDEADYFLFFDHKIESLMSRISLELTTGVRGGMGTYRREGPFDRTISLRVVDAVAFRAGGNETLWASTAVIWAAPTESPKFDDLLLLATFRHFAQDTGATVVERMNLETQAARKLR